MTVSFGFVTIAMGSKAYLEMAVDMALSLRAFHDNPICLICDTTLATPARTDYARVFDVVETLPDDLPAYPAAKFQLSRLLPFDTGFFIDADVLVLAPLDRVIEASRGLPVSVMGSFVAPGTAQRHHNIPVDDLISAFGLTRYFTNHNGAFFYQRKPATEFFEDCAEVFLELLKPAWSRKGFIGNELAFGVVNGRWGIEPMPCDFPVIWPDEMARMEPGYTEKPLLHFIDMPPIPVFRDLMRQADTRRREADLPVVGSEVWLRKGMKSQRTRLSFAGRIQSRIAEAKERANT